MKRVRIAGMSDIYQFEKIPFEQRMSATNTYDLIRQGSEINPDSTAISFMFSGDQFMAPLEITYRDLLATIHRTANLLNDLGVGPQDVVTYLLPNAPHTHYTLWGGEAAGIVNPINPMLEAGTIKDICQAAKTKVLVALGEIPGSDIWQKVEAIRHELPHLQAIIRVFGPSDEKEGILGFDEVIGNYNGDGLDSRRQFDPMDICSMYHTGGTTGTPKLAPHTHYNEAAMISIMKSVHILQPGETVLCGLPLFHVNGTIITGGFPFAIGAHVVILSPQGYRDPTVIPNFYKMVEHYQASFFSCVPTILSVLLDIPKGDTDISSLKFALCGAAPLSSELLRRFEAHTDMKVLEGYGLTEGTTASSLNPLDGERRAGSIGIRLPYSDMKVFVKEGTNVREANTDEIGAICISGPTVFNGYLDQNKNTGIWMKEGWFDTGDLGRQDTDGYFWLTGRKKDLIIRGGHNIDPAAIEEPLYKLPGVQVAAAVGRPDSHAGEVPVAFVQLQQDSDLTAEQIMEYLKKEIGERAAIPKEVFILEEIPLTPVGKIFKPSLRWDAIRLVYLNEVLGLGDSITAADVQVREDSVHGCLAEIVVTAAPSSTRGKVEEAIKATLARYTVRYELTIH